MFPLVQVMLAESGSVKCDEVCSVTSHVRLTMPPENMEEDDVVIVGTWGGGTEGERGREREREREGEREGEGEGGRGREGESDS